MKGRAVSDNSKLKTMPLSGGALWAKGQKSKLPEADTLPKLLLRNAERLGKRVALRE